LEWESEETTVLAPPEYEPAQDDWSLPDTTPVVDYSDIQEIEIAVMSLAEELPYFLLPKDLEIGPYTLVFEAIGHRETLSRTETNILYLGYAKFNLKDISMYLSGLSGSQLISPGTTVMLETRLDFNNRLDPYIVWYSGRNVIREGRMSDGAGNILWTAPEQIGFYALRVEAFPFYLKQRTNFIGLSREITLPVSPKAVSLGYFFENNPVYTARSSLSAGTAYHEQVQLIEAMIAAKESAENSVAEDSTEDSVNEEPEEEIILIPPSPPELLQWYQFEGNLRNAVSPLTGRQTLTPANESSPRWAAVGQSYGLSTGSNDPYLFSPVKFFRTKQEEGGGILLLHIRPPTEGIIFNALFPWRASSTDGVWMDLIKERNIIALRLRTEGETVEIPVYFASSTGGFTPIVVEFYIRPYRLEAKISLGDNLQKGIGEIKYTGSLSGEGIIRLGGSLANARLANARLESTLETLMLAEYQSEENPYEMIAAAISAEELNMPAAVEKFTSNTVWDELAILYSTVPLLPEDLPEEDIIEEDADINEDADEVVNTETAEKKTETSVTPAVQRREADTEAKPVAAKLPASDSDTENSVSEAVDEETVKEEAEANDLIKEQETQEHNTLTVLSENS